MNNNRMLITILVLVIVLGGIGWFLSVKGLLPGMNSSTSGSSKPSQWQALFLSNGQVYFGRLSDENSQYATLEEIYYLQLAQSPQPEGQNTPAAQQSQQQTQISLVKLGNELHGPVDKMKINRDHILFIEDMKSDAKVVEAIERYKREGPTTATPAPEVSASPKK